MSVGTLWIVIASLAWAASDALRKRLAGPMGPVALAWWMSVGSAPIFGLWVGLAEAGWPAPAYWPWAIAAFAGTLCATLLMLAALAVADLGVAIPMLALTPVFSALVAWATIGEVLDPGGWIGVVLVVTGAVGLQLHGRRWKPDRGAAMIAGVALLWSMTSVFDKVALQHAAVPAHAGIQVGGSALVLGPWLALRGRARDLLPPPGHRAAAVGLVLAFGLAFGAQLLAVQLEPVSRVETIKRAMGLASAVVLGRLFFDERLNVARIAGVTLMGLGAALVLG